MPIREGSIGTLASGSRSLAANENTPLLAKRIAATVYSATGTALAAAAEVTRTSLAHTASVTCHFTVPAA